VGEQNGCLTQYNLDSEIVGRVFKHHPLNHVVFLKVFSNHVLASDTKNVISVDLETDTCDSLYNVPNLFSRKKEFTLMIYEFTRKRRNNTQEGTDK
jgi:hypothetical protein